MEFSLSFDQINWISVFVAALSTFVIGSLWYSPVLFSKIWQKEVGLTKEDIQGVSMPFVFGSSFVLEFVAAIVLDLFIGSQGTLLSGVKIAFIAGLGLVATSIGTNYLFAQKSFKLFLIDAGYFILFFVIMGAILGAW